MSIKDFQILSKLGEGAYSSVYKVLRIADNLEYPISFSRYALKKVQLQELTEKEVTNALNEVRILASIRSPYIVAYKEGFITEASQNLW
jgi:NIMA (never in mitosis gene a)-related kinase 1/4/5